METDVDVWAVISRYDGYARAFLPYITAIGVFAAVWFGWRRDWRDRMSQTRPEPIFEINNFFGMKGDGFLEWSVKVRSDQNVGLTLVKATGKRDIFIFNDGSFGAEHRAGIGQSGKGGEIYKFGVSRERIKQPVSVTFFWRWNDEDKIRKTVKKVRLQ